MFSHTDIQLFQIFLYHANQYVQLQYKINILICDNGSWRQRTLLHWGNFNRVFLPSFEKPWPIIKAEWFSDFVAKDTYQLIDLLSLALNWVVDRKTQKKRTCSIRTEIQKLAIGAGE
jgi:hypothetical protein